MRTLIARAPTRIDFGGGWTDVPPYTHEQGGCVCNVAITRYATAMLSDDGGDASRATGNGDATPDAHPALVTAALRRAGLHGVRVALSSGFPFGAGLGGSSAAGVAVAGAAGRWIGRTDSAEQIAEESHAIEVEELNIAGGRQDHYAAAVGGALFLRFDGDDTHVHRVQLDPSLATALARRTIVVYTGQSRISALTINAVIDSYRARVPAVVAALARMKALAEAQATALSSGNIDDLGRLVGEHWTHQRSLHPAITTPLIDAVVERAMSVGALGVKALGASGGGCVVAIAPDGGEVQLRDAMSALAEPLEADVSMTGFEIMEEADIPHRAHMESGR